MVTLWVWLSMVVMTLSCNSVQGFGAPSMALKIPAKCPIVICPGFGNDARDCKLRATEFGVPVLGSSTYSLPPMTQTSIALVHLLRAL